VGEAGDLDARFRFDDLVPDGVLEPADRGVTVRKNIVYRAEEWHFFKHAGQCLDFVDEQLGDITPSMVHQPGNNLGD